MKKYSIVTILVTLALVIFNILFANYGVWFGRGDLLENFASNEAATVSEVQSIYAKEHFISFIVSQNINIKDKESSVNNFWNSKNEKTEFSDKPAPLSMVKAVYKDANDTKRGTMFSYYYKSNCLLILIALVLYSVALILTYKKTYINLILSLIMLNLGCSLLIPFYSLQIALLVLNVAILISTFIKARYFKFIKYFKQIPMELLCVILGGMFILNYCILAVNDVPYSYKILALITLVIVISIYSSAFYFAKAEKLQK